MEAANDALSEHMANFDKDRSYTTVALLGERATQRTEHVFSSTKRQCVRKYLPLDTVDAELFRELQTVSNAHLARVLDCYELGSNLVFVTEYVEGVSLETLVKNMGPLTPAQAETLMADVVDALQALHNAPSGPIVHRDVKPSNIIVSQQGAVLIDFDIARKWDDATNQDTHIWGTSGYAAPEQFGFRQTDARTDIYALGVVLRFMLTGKGPQEKTALEAGKLKNLIESSMSLDPANRPQTVADFQKALSRAVSSLGDKSKKIVVLPQEPKPPAQRLTVRHALWRTWQIVITVLCGLLLLSLLAIIAGFVPLAEGSTFTPDMYIPVLIFSVIIPWLLCCDGFGILERILWFKEDRLIKVLGMTFVSFIVGFVLAYAIQSIHIMLS